MREQAGPLPNSSGNGYTVTLNNGTAWANGKFGKALSFDGINDDASTALTPGNAGTISVWFKPASTINSSSGGDLAFIATGRNGLVFNWEGPVGVNCNNGADTNIGSLDLPITPSPGNYSVGCTTTTTWTAGQWYFVVATWDGVNQRMYVNGALEDDVSQTETGGWDTVDIGFGIFKGLVDTVRVYSRALSASDVTELYAYGPPDAPSSLVTSSATGGVNLSWTVPADSGDSNLETYGIWRSTSPFFSIAADSSCTPSAGGTATVETNASQTTYTLSSFTVSSSGNSQILVVTASTENGQTATAATFNSQAMTLIATPGVGTNASAAMFYMVNPPVTTANVVVSYGVAPATRAGVSATVLDCVDTATAPLSNSTTASGNISSSVTVVTPNTLLIDALGNENSATPATTQSGQTATLAEPLGTGSSWGVSYKLEAGTGSSAMGFGLNRGKCARGIGLCSPTGQPRKCYSYRFLQHHYDDVYRFYCAARRQLFLPRHREQRFGNKHLFK